MSAMDQPPSGETVATKGDEAAAPAAPASGPAGLKVDRGIARRAADEHVRTVSGALCAAASNQLLTDVCCNSGGLVVLRFVQLFRHPP
jgi:hypothetical protein